MTTPDELQRENAALRTAVATLQCSYWQAMRYFTHVEECVGPEKCKCARERGYHCAAVDAAVKGWTS